MSKRQILILLGVWISLVLFLGFPASWDKVILSVTGIVVLVVAFSLPTQEKLFSSEKLPYVEKRNSDKNIKDKVSRNATVTNNTPIDDPCISSSEPEGSDTIHKNT